jgi:NADPH:quinone reductase
VLGNEGAGVVEASGDDRFPDGSRVMFTGPYGVSENGAFSELVAVKSEHLCLIPENIDGAAAGVPVAYLTAIITLRAAGFVPGKTVFAPAIGGSVGNAVIQVARALGAKHAISSTTSHAKAVEAEKLGFSEVVDLSTESLTEGVRRLSDGYGADIIVDSLGGDVLSEALGVLARGGSLTTLGYAASRKTTIDVTNLIWKDASIKSFSLFAQPVSVLEAAWTTIRELLKSSRVKPIVAKTFPLESAAEALRYLVEGRPFGRVLVTT